MAYPEMKFENSGQRTETVYSSIGTPCELQKSQDSEIDKQSFQRLNMLTKKELTFETLSKAVLPKHVGTYCYPEEVDKKKKSV